MLCGFSGNPYRELARLRSDQMTDDRQDRPDARKGQKPPRALVLRPARLHSGGASVGCEILNISADGLKVRVAPNFVPAGRLTLSVESCGEYDCDVVWHHGGSLGLEFPVQNAETVALYDALLADSEGATGARETTRVQVLWNGLLHAGERSSTCRIVNVSLGGAKAQASNPSDIPSPVTLKIDRFGEFYCEIAWREGDYLGLRFLADKETIAETIGQAVPQILRDLE
jgi:hypothetical protein